MPRYRPLDITAPAREKNKFERMGFTFPGSRVPCYFSPVLWIRNFLKDPDPDTDPEKNIPDPDSSVFKTKLLWKIYKIWQFLNQNAQFNNNSSLL